MCREKVNNKGNSKANVNMIYWVHKFKKKNIEKKETRHSNWAFTYRTSHVNLCHSVVKILHLEKDTY